MFVKKTQETHHRLQHLLQVLLRLVPVAQRQQGLAASEQGLAAVVGVVRLLHF